MQFVIRKATLEDAYSLAEVLAKSWESAYKNIIPMEQLKKYTNIERRYEMFKTMLMNPKGEFYISLFRNLPCGEFMFCNSRDKDLSDYGEIVSIYLLEEYWDKGFGKGMMMYALKVMREYNYNNVLLWVFKEN